MSNCYLKFYCDYPSCAEMEGKSSASVTELLQFSFSQCSGGGWQTSAFRYNCADQRIHHLCLLHISPHLFSTPQFYQWKNLKGSLGNALQTTAAGRAQSISTSHLTWRRLNLTAVLFCLATLVGLIKTKTNTPLHAIEHGLSSYSWLQKCYIQVGRWVAGKQKDR